MGVQSVKYLEQPMIPVIIMELIKPQQIMGPTTQVVMGPTQVVMGPTQVVMETQTLEVVMEQKWDKNLGERRLIIMEESKNMERRKGLWIRLRRNFLGQDTRYHNHNNNIYNMDACI